MKHGGGYIKDAPEKRTQKNFEEHALYKDRADTLPPAASLLSFAHQPVLDQNQCGSCTGHGTAQGIFVSFAAKGTPLPFMPSPKSVYAIVRTIEAQTSEDALTDSGAMPSDLMIAISKFGIRAMTAPSPRGFNTDVDPSNVTEKEDLLSLEAAAVHLLVGDQRIDEASPTFIAQVCAAIAGGAAVGLGIYVDSAFENWDPSQPALESVDLGDPNGGGHWIACVAYDTAANGKIMFTLLNSWGESWGSAGCIYVTEDWMRAAVSDVYPLIASEVA